MADFITVTATIERADAEPRVRFVIFTPTAIVYDSVGNVIYTTEPIKVPVQSDGSLGITGDGVDLLATNSTGINPESFQYKVRLDYTHPLRDPREWFIEIDKDEPGGTVDLADLAPASFVDASFTYVLRTEYQQLLDDMGETILPDTTGVPDGQALLRNAEEPLGTEWSSDIVHLTGAETITGVKTFDERPVGVIPDSSGVDDGAVLVTKASDPLDTTWDEAPVIRTKNRPVNVAAHGARPAEDGATNLAALRAAITEAGSYGEVYQPAGSIPVTADTDHVLTLPAGLKWGGEGVNSELLISSVAADKNVFHGEGVDTGVLRDFRIAAAVANDGNQGAVYLDECAHWLVENVEQDGFDRGFWFVNGSASSTPDANNFNNVARSCRSYNSYGYGFHLACANGGGWEFCYAEGARSQDGFKTSLGSQRVGVLFNHAKGHARDGFDFYDGFIESRCIGNLSEGNTFNGWEIKGDAGTAKWVDRLSIIDGNIAIGNGQDGFHYIDIRHGLAHGTNYGISNTRRGFHISNSRDVSWGTLVGARNTQEGIYVTGSATRNHAVALVAVDNSWDDGSNQNFTYNGVHFENATLWVIGQVFSRNGDVTTARGGQNYGLWLDNTNATANYIGAAFLLNNNNAIGDTTWADGNQIPVIHDGTRWRGARLRSLTSAGFFTGSGDNADWLVERASGATLRLQAQSALATVGTSSNHNLAFITNGAQRWRIDSSGHLAALAAGHTMKSGVGATGSRPSASTVGVGAQWFDTTLGIPIWSDATNWRDAAGNVV